jgi:glycosyltransferase involved in cell wall biosynthesis
MMATTARDLVINGRFLSQATTGVQRVSREVTREIDRLVADGSYDLRVRLLCQKDASPDELDLSAIQVERVGGGTGHWWEQVQLPRRAGSATLLCLGNTAPMASLLGRGRTAVMIHDLSYRLYPEAYSWQYRLAHGAMLPLLLRRADPLITVCESERMAITQHTGMAADQILVASNGAWPGETPPDRGLPIEDRADGYILYVGALSQRKNLQGALAAAVRLADEEGMRTVFVGAKPSILTSTHVELSPKAKECIEFAGQIESLDRLAEFYRGARCLMIPSFYESSCLPPTEAMTFGCPVVVSDIPALRERCGEAGEFCDPHDVDSIVAAVRRVTHDPIRARQLVELGFKQAATFSWRTQARIILQALFGPPAHS